MASAEGGVWGGVSPLQPTIGALGERREQSPGRKGIWRILKATERSFLYLYRPTDALSNLVLEILKHDKI